ncbi:MAG: ice-binding family protein [Crocinitomicaceae bacterium]
MKTINLLVILSIISVASIVGCKKDNFSEKSGICPLVLSTKPADGEVNVFLNQDITIVFNDKMDPATITDESILISDGSPVSGTIAYNDSTVTFTPSSALEINTTYIGTVKTSVKNLTGNALQEDYIWTFSTGSSIMPVVIATSPVNNKTNVPMDKTVTAKFNIPMDPLTINTSTFTLTEGGNLVAGTIYYSGTTAFFDPNVDLLPSTMYTATITTGATSTTTFPLENDYVWTFTTYSSILPPPIDLGTVEDFGIISGVGVSNDAGASEIHDMNVGIYPGPRSSITGFFDVDGGPGLIFNGDFFGADDPAPVPAMLLQAKDDLTDAYLAAEGMTSPAPVTVAGDIGGQTLAPGIYKSTSTLLVQNGNLTLDAQGDPNAFWVFQIASDFTTVGGSPYPSPAGGNIILTGGAQAKNVFWQVGSSATIGDYTSFSGNILALTSVTMNAYSQAVGRMLCSNGSVTLTSTNFIFKP